MIIELEMVPIAEEMEHPIDSIRTEIKEFFEQYGWRVLKVDGYDDDED
jgi:hypothetical protein